MSKPSPESPTRTHTSEGHEAQASDPGREPRVQRGRRTVAVLMDFMDQFNGGQESRLRRSFDAACRKFDLNLLIAFGHPLDSPHPWGAAHNAVYPLMAAHCVDGLVVLSSQLATYCDQERIRRFCQGYGSRPLCSVGLAVPGVPSVLVDHRSGLEALVAHLVGDHHCRRLAFVGGPAETPDTKLRLEVFRSALQRHGMDCDPNLIANADFVQHSGQDAVNEILNRGTKPDAVVVGNDGMALGVIAALRQRGFRVPHDIPVTGFGNLSIGRLVSPPLTTVSQPFQSMAEKAIELLVDQLAGRSVPACTHVPAELVTRQSCGCNRRTRRRSSPDALEKAAHLLRTRADHIRHALADCLQECDADACGEATTLVEALQAELEGRTESFSVALEALISKVGDEHERYCDFQNAISCLRAELRQVATVELEDLWHEARRLIALVTARHHAEQRSRIDEASRRWVDTQDLFSTAIDQSDLSRSLAKGLRSVGVRSAFVSQYFDNQRSELEPLLCMVDGAERQPVEPRYPARELFPTEGYSTLRRHTSLVFPLAFEAQPLGVAVFEYSAEVCGYEVLRSQISAALRSVELHQEVMRRTVLHERSLQERSAAAERLQSLTVLAGGVAHDLNNVLGPIAALPDVIAGELVGLLAAGLDADGQSIISDIRSDVQEMKHAALRASQIVVDLLTSGRQGHMTKEPLDLNQAVGTSLAVASAGSASDGNQNVSVTSDLHPKPLIVSASEPHIVRAISNLIRNAIEAIQGDGRIVVRTRHTTVVEPETRYETIAPGDYAVVSVSDTGDGIRKQGLDRIFEPFFSRKRLTNRSGSGLGLAIVHSVTKEHQGFIDVESAVGMGSTFTLYFPRVVEATQEPVRLSYAPRSCLRVLVVDDDPAQLRTARRVLSHFGYDVDTASNVAQACAPFERAAASLEAPAAEDEPPRSPYDVVVLDMILSDGEDGLDLFERIQGLFPSQKGIMASGHADSQRAQLAISRGLVWLAKPYTADSLAQAVHDVLGTGCVEGCE